MCEWQVTDKKTKKVKKNIYWCIMFEIIFGMNIFDNNAVLFTLILLYFKLHVNMFLHQLSLYYYNTTSHVNIHFKLWVNHCTLLLPQLVITTAIKSKYLVLSWFLLIFKHGTDHVHYTLELHGIIINSRPLLYLGTFFNIDFISSWFTALR